MHTRASAFEKTLPGSTERSQPFAFSHQPPPEVHLNVHRLQQNGIVFTSMNAPQQFGLLFPGGFACLMLRGYCLCCRRDKAIALLSVTAIYILQESSPGKKKRYETNIVKLGQRQNLQSHSAPKLSLKLPHHFFFPCRVASLQSQEKFFIAAILSLIQIKRSPCLWGKQSHIQTCTILPKKKFLLLSYPNLPWCNLTPLPLILFHCMYFVPNCI